MESPDLRRRTMQAVKSKNTAPEMVVRRLLHGKGYRYRLHRRDLPGCPDLVFPSRRKIIFVHGCFWHGHDCPRGSRVPKSNTAYWLEKVARNRERDFNSKQRLKSNGWQVCTIWECQVKSPVIRKLEKFLTS